MSSSTDAELIGQSRERGQFFQRIFNRHAPLIMRYLRLRVGEDLAEELTAETRAAANASRPT